MKNVTLQSGATLDIQTANFATGTKLIKIVARELKTVNVDIGLGDGKLEDFFKMNFNKDGLLNTFKDAIFQLIASDALDQVLWECLDRCLYTKGDILKLRITRDMFDKNDDIKGDFYPIAKEVLVANLAPFFPSLLSKLSTAVAKVTSDQKSESKPTPA